MAKIGYIRVSSKEQNEARQVAALEFFNIDKWFIEKISGKNTNRPEFQSMMNYVRAGDIIYINDFSRLSRSVTDLLNIIEELEKRQIGLISLKENLDTSTATGKLMLTMIAAINEFERANLLERQAEGITLAKEKGIYKGRKPILKPSNWNEVFTQYQTKEITASEAMKKLNLKRNTFYKFVRGTRAGNSHSELYKTENISACAL